MTIAAAFALVALILSVVVLVQSRASNLLAWATLLLSLIYVWPVFR